MPTDVPYYRVGQRQRVLRPLPNTALVVPKRGVHPAIVGGELSKYAEVTIDARAPPKHILMRGNVQDLAEVEADPVVHHTRGAYVDARGTELVLTDEILVRFAEGISDAQRSKICQNFNCTELRRTKTHTVLRVDQEGHDAPLNIANELAADPQVDFAEPNALQTSLTPLLPAGAATANQGPALAGLPWHLKNEGQFSGKPGADLNIADAWALTLGAPHVRIVLHDTGVEITHPALQGQCLDGWDFTDDDLDANPAASYPNYAHGTATAGLIAAIELGGVATAVGVARGCKLVPLRAQGYLTWEKWAASFTWAARHGEIIACPWALSENTLVSEAITLAFEEGRGGKGVPCFCAAGNDDLEELAYPASHSAAISVGACTNQDRHPSYSHRDVQLDFVAPSSGGTLGVATIDMIGGLGFNDEDNGDFIHATSPAFGGTSAAAALAAGVAALMLSVNDNLTATEIRQILRETAVAIDPDNGAYQDGGSRFYGRGRIDAGAAVKAAAKDATP